MLKYQHTLVLYNRIIFFLSLLGIILAVYVLQSYLRNAPIVCLTDGCELVRKSASSRLFGIPVPAFGLIGYTCLLILCFLRSLLWKNIYLFFMVGIAMFGVVFVSWFTYTQLVFIKAVCTWCAVSTVNMIVIFFLTLQSYRLTTKR